MMENHDVANNLFYDSGRVRMSGDIAWKSVEPGIETFYGIPEEQLVFVGIVEID